MSFTTSVNDRSFSSSVSYKRKSDHEGDKSPTSTKKFRVSEEEQNHSPYIVFEHGHYQGGLIDGKPDGEGCYVYNLEGDIVYKGSFKKGKIKGYGCITDYNDYCIKAKFISSDILDPIIDKDFQYDTVKEKGTTHYKGRSINHNNEGLLWKEDGRIVKLVNFNKHKSFEIRSIEKRFIETPPKNTSFSKDMLYNFKPGTCCLDISSDSAPHSELIEKLGFCFFLLNQERLHNSARKVQEHIKLGLIYLHIEYKDDLIEDFYHQLPIPDNNRNYQHSLLIEKLSGDVVGAIFVNMDAEPKKITSVKIKKKIRYLGLGSLLLSNTIWKLQKSFNCCKFLLNSNTELFTWYQSFGFIHDQNNCLSLDLSNGEQNARFSQKKKNLPIKIFELVMLKENFSKNKNYTKRAEVVKKIRLELKKESDSLEKISKTLGCDTVYEEGVKQNKLSLPEFNVDSIEEIQQNFAGNISETNGQFPSKFENFSHPTKILTDHISPSTTSFHFSQEKTHNLDRDSNVKEIEEIKSKLKKTSEEINMLRELQNYP